jgi:hypothetical protein
MILLPPLPLGARSEVLGVTAILRDLDLCRQVLRPSSKQTPPKLRSLLLPIMKLPLVYGNTQSF